MSPLKFLRPCLLLLVVCSTFAATPVQPAGAQEPAADPLRKETSLKFVPADASFYYSRLRMRQQYDAVIKSVAWTKFLEMPALQMAKDLADMPPVPELEGAKPAVDDFFAAAENKELVELLYELISDEAFIYGGVGFAETYETLQKVSRLMNEQALENPERLNEKVLPLLETWKAPDLVIGFKIKDAKRAEGQLARLEKLIAEQLEAAPPIKERFQREKIGDSEFITLKLDGSLLPWKQLKDEADPENAKEFEKVVQRLNKMTLVVQIGIHDGYLLISVGDTDEHLRKLGQGQLLVDRPELAPLRKHGDKSFYTLSFVSERFLKSASDVDGQIDNYVAMAEKLLPESELDPQVQQELLVDLKALGADIKTWIPKPGNYLGFGFFSARGTEGYSYDWSEQLSLDGTQRLSILDHVGGKPLAFAAARAKYAPEVHDVRVKWLGRGLYWFERLGLPQFEPEQVTFYEKLRVDFMPLFLRLDVALKNMWIPAFKDGQSAFVIDAKVTSDKWVEGMPPPKKPLPLLEIGTVSGVSDAGLLKQASSEFFDIAQQTMNVLNTHFPDFIEKTELTPPKTREFPEGTIYFYSPPPDSGLDPQIAPNAGLSADTLALSYVPKFSLRLLKKTPLEIKTGPLALADKPLAAASYVDLAGMVDTLGAWIDYGFEQSDAAGLEEVDEETLKSSREQVQTVLELLKCVRSISSVSYFENGALVTHSEWHISDRQQTLNTAP